MNQSDDAQSNKDASISGTQIHDIKAFLCAMGGKSQLLLSLQKGYISIHMADGRVGCMASAPTD